ncbi:ImmA/IrrE family metallo-endopeptidase [Paenibacillus lautus]|uniref:ImmA/IrrE family metallo-endopeptidase n=1 Tax=Paenibacillus lautus TaxID=1401 RepID=UPI003D2980DF
MANTKNIFTFPILKAQSLFSRYYSREMDLKTYRCDEFLVRLIQDNNIRLDLYPFKSDKFCGLLTIDEDEITIVVNKNSPAVRRNFTIAHELGHFYLHRHLNSNFPDRASDLLNSSDIVFEKQANAFASEIVLPNIVVYIMLKSKFSFNRISAVTQTSHETLRWRLIRFLIGNFKMSHNKCVEMVNDFEDSSIFGYKKCEIHDFIAKEVYKKLVN